MDLLERIEAGLYMALSHSAAQGCPPKLAGALRYAVFPGGARIAVAAGQGDGCGNGGGAAALRIAGA